MDTGFQFGQMNNALEMDGNDCTSVNYLSSLNCTPKNN
jgi:hypothetical protein